MFFASPIKHWEEGLQAAKQAKYAEAISYYNVAIQEDKEEKCFFIRQDRAVAYMFLEKYPEALVDLDYLLSKDLKISEKINVFRLKFSALVYLDRKEEARIFYEEAGELDCQSIILEKYEDCIVVRNMNPCKCFQTIMENVYEKIGWCNKKEDIRKYPGGVWIMDYKPCCDDCGKTVTKQNCGGSKSTQKDLEAVNVVVEARDLRERDVQKEIDLCQERCVEIFDIARDMCAIWYKNPACATACLGVTYSLKRGCLWCCSNGNFWEKCIEPFSFIKNLVKCPEDPAWDD